MNRFFAVPALAFSLVLLAECTSKSNKKEMMKGGKDAPPIPVTAAQVSPKELENKIQVVGTVLPNEKVELRSEVAGRITGIFFKEGSRVNKGALLVKIYDQDLKAQLKKVRIQQQLASKEEERKKKLLAINGISEEEYDIASNQAVTLTADAELLESQLRKTEIIAPFSGTVGLRYVSEGENVSSSTLISTLQQIDPVKLEFDVPERYSLFINQGSLIKFTVSGSDKVYTGSVYAVEPMIDVATRTLKVRARCNNKEQNLKPGAFVKIELLLGKNPSALMIPTESVISGVRGQKVYVYSNGIALSRKVSTGIRDERNIEITEGLQANDTVITSGIIQLKDSARVHIKLK